MSSSSPSLEHLEVNNFPIVPVILDLVSLVNGEGGVEELLILIINVPIIMVIIKIILMIIIKIIIMIILITWSALPMVRVVSRNSTPSFFSPSSSRKI